MTSEEEELYRATFDLACSHRDSGDYARAQALFLGIASQASQARLLAIVHATLADMLFDIGKLDEARTHYEASLSKRPQATHPSVGLSQVLVAQGLRQEGLEEFARGLALRPCREHVEVLAAFLKDSEQFNAREREFLNEIEHSLAASDID